ncbi:hypothetical protein F5J12DRAFT_507985 [Pisolithus orientalis]|uniref:uncharacterized protein n=1 Tax=Pisolithus orientalis TaxID=936130 RepID=UPI002224DE84|nr:uncharacterized protein F5J12DRAFT_507985 [Pisolithus orientalis]KAI5988948.1 hypothetical protein F5J12DRAFT_507985 [Pisolithus orientalis]
MIEAIYVHAGRSVLWFSATNQCTVASLSRAGVDATVPESNRVLRDRIEAIIDLTKDFGADLPPMRIQSSPRDDPRMHTDWRIRDMALSAARQGTTIRQSRLPPITEGGWIQACPPNSLARLNPPVLPSLDGSNPMLSSMTLLKSFIVSHRTAMDPCYHPEILISHGQFLSHRQGPLPLPYTRPSILALGCTPSS